MIKNPYLNALAAAVYIVSIVLVINLFGEIQMPDNILMPMVALSLLVLSVALMGVLFFYEPVRLFLEGRQRESLSFFTKTTVCFAGLTVLLVILMFLISVL